MLRPLRVPFLLIILLSSCASPVQNTPDRAIRGEVEKNAMVVSAHPLASAVGRDILKQGGNAVDAAIAVQFALAVVHPAAGNIGGGGFMVIREPNGDVYCLDFREKAPGKASRNMYLDEDGDVIENLSLRGHLASGVPGSVDGMSKAFERFGSKTWDQLLEPAVALASDGFELTEKEAGGLNWIQEAMTETNTVAAPQFTGNWKAGDRVANEDLANTLRRIKTNGRDGFYKGETAELIVQEMQRGNGFISLEDLANYDAQWRTAVTGDYRGYNIISMPPPSSGGIALIQLLKMVEPYPIGEWGFQDPRTVHLITEAERRVYADRATHLGDPDFYNVPDLELIDAGYLKRRMEDFSMEGSSDSENIAAGRILAESEETTHFSIVDANGTAVSVTTTLNGGFGSKLVVGGAGFFLNNEMDDFSIKPGVPNMFGLLGGEANAIVPGKRMLSSMTPTIVTKDGELFMVVGTPGGATIITSVFQTIVNVIDHKMSMQGAVSAPRFHHQWYPTDIFYERGSFPSPLIESLEKLGHSVKERGQYGRVDGILVLPNGQLEGGADPRGDDSAKGF